MRFTIILSAALSVLSFNLTNGFTPILQSRVIGGSTSTTTTKLHEKVMNENDNNNNDDDNVMSRRKVFQNVVIQTTTLATLTSTSFANVAKATNEESLSTMMGSDKLHPISIIGAGGKVGNLCTDILNKKGLYTKAITRSGRKTLDKDSDFVSYASGDVTNYEMIKKAVDGSSGVIFAASASGKKKGGDPEHVDYLGLYYTAKVCFFLTIMIILLNFFNR